MKPKKKQKTVTETGWAIWDDEGICCSYVLETQELAWIQFCEPCNLSIKQAIERGYRCLKTTAKGVL